MPEEKFKAEMFAYQSFTKLLEDAKACVDAFYRANLEVPIPLKRLMGLGVENEGFHQLALISPIKREHIPTEAGTDWISIPVDQCLPTTVTLAVLRREGGRMKSRDVKDAVCAMVPNTSPTAVANIATRLKDNLIGMGEDGWELLDQDSAPVIDNGYLWGPPSVFQKQEVAAHRREAIQRILENYPSGLQIVQIVDELKRLPWVKAPVNKDLLKEDMAAMQKDGTARRRGNSGKWELGREAESG